MKIETESETSN